MTLCREFAKDLGPLSSDTALVHLRVLATTDLHAMLMPFDYYADSRDDSVGLVHVAGLVEAVRAQTPNCLLLDNGDTFQGSVLGDVAVKTVTCGGAPHPMIVAMNALGYDAATLGNHDFDYGLDVLDAILSGARFPVVLANAQHPGNGKPYVPRHVMLERQFEDLDGQRHRIRIGVTGTAPPQVAQWSRAILNGDLTFCDAVSSIEHEARILRAAGADIVVALAHSGLGDGNLRTPACGAENAAHAIAALPEVDVVVAGHTHEVHPNERDLDIRPPRAPIVQPGYWGSHLGCIDMALVKQDGVQSPGWRIAKAHAEALPVDKSARAQSASALRRFLRANPVLRRTIGAGHRTTRAATARELGRCEVPLNTYFSVLAPCPATQLIADVQRHAARELLGNDPRYRDMPVISAVGPMRSGGLAGPHQFTDIPPGPIRLRHVSDLYCYANGLSVLRISGRGVKNWLERSASQYIRIDPRSPSRQSFVDHDFASYNFDRLDGLVYDIDVSAPARTDAHGERWFDTPGRVRNLRYPDGRPVDPDEQLLIATNSYRASGGGNFGISDEAETVVSGTTPVRDLIAEFIDTRSSEIRPIPNPTFTLVGFGDAVPVFETGPGALAHSGQFAALGLSPIGMSAGGFLSLEYRPGTGDARCNAHALGDLHNK